MQGQLQKMRRGSKSEDQEIIKGPSLSRIMTWEMKTGCSYLVKEQGTDCEVRGPKPQLLVFIYFTFSLRTKNKLGCPSFLDFVFVFGFNRYSG